MFLWGERSCSLLMTFVCCAVKAEVVFRIICFTIAASLTKGQPHSVNGGWFDVNSTWAPQWMMMSWLIHRSESACVCVLWWIKTQVHVTEELVTAPAFLMYLPNTCLVTVLELSTGRVHSKIIIRYQLGQEGGHVPLTFKNDIPPPHSQWKLHP